MVEEAIAVTAVAVSDINSFCFGDVALGYPLVRSRAEDLFHKLVRKMWLHILKNQFIRRGEMVASIDTREACSGFP
jgi:hypothetical protein